MRFGNTVLCKTYTELKRWNSLYLNVNIPHSVRGIFSREINRMLKHPMYSPDLASCDFFFSIKHAVR